MPAGRPAKRAADPAAAASGDAQSTTAAPTVVSAPAHATSTSQGKVKLPRIDSKNQEDFSAQVKNRLNQYTRTGQACDRCKVRPPLLPLFQGVLPFPKLTLSVARSGKFDAMPSPKVAHTAFSPTSSAT